MRTTSHPPHRPPLLCRLRNEARESIVADRWEKKGDSPALLALTCEEERELEDSKPREAKEEAARVTKLERPLQRTIIFGEREREREGRGAKMKKAESFGPGWFLSRQYCKTMYNT